MKEIYEASSGMGEVSESALKTYGKDKKTNNNLFISISKAVGLFFASQILQSPVWSQSGDIRHKAIHDAHKACAFGCGYPLDAGSRALNAEIIQH